LVKSIYKNLRAITKQWREIKLFVPLEGQGNDVSSHYSYLMSYRMPLVYKYKKRNENKEKQIKNGKQIRNLKKEKKQIRKIRKCR
jgi:hypothetical protein